MGVSLGFSSSKSASCRCTSDNVAPNPNPFNFTILKQKTIGTCRVMEVFYRGCTTFEGRKLLLLNDKNSKLPYHPEKLDPHLLGGRHPVVARFEPTEQGWGLAILCAKALTLHKR